MSILYLVATPIGNLEDISYRAIRTLKEVDLIAAENADKIRKLLSFYNIKTPVTTYHEQGKKAKLSHIIEHLEESNVALVTEAGTPTISDPGYDLIREALQRGIQVSAIPGPSAIPIALALSGLPCSQFLFLGFLPRKKNERRRVLEEAANEPCTLVIFEAPHRLIASLSDIAEILGDRAIAVCRELTKFYEEVFRGTVREALAYFVDPKGEFTLVISGNDRSSHRDISKTVREQLKRLHDQGYSAKDATQIVSQSSGIPKKTLYREWLALT